MKKALYLLTIMLMLVGGSIAQTTARSSVRTSMAPQSSSTVPVVTVTAPTTAIEMGTNFTIPVTVSDTTGLGIIAYQFDLHYDPTVIQPQANAVDVNGTISNGLIPVFNPNTPGVIKVAVYGAYPLTGAGTLINFNFTAVGAAGSTSPLTWVNFMFNEGNPGKNAVNGQIQLFAHAEPVPTDFVGREINAGTSDLINNLFRDNSFILVSSDPANASSLTLSMDMIPVNRWPGIYDVVSGHWSMTVMHNGQYVGSLYGDTYRGRVWDSFDPVTGGAVRRKVKTQFHVRGGLGSYAHINIQEMNNIDFALDADYTNGRSVTALIYPF